MQMCLIMDEVDGMSAGDRGGVADLIQTLKGAKLPIICICNDKYNQKLKSLRNHCLELDYRYVPMQAPAHQLHTCMIMHMAGNACLQQTATQWPMALITLMHNSNIRISTSLVAFSAWLGACLVHALKQSLGFFCAHETGRC